jgi:hypothetical protein
MFLIISLYVRSFGPCCFPSFHHFSICGYGTGAWKILRTVKKHARTHTNTHTRMYVCMYVCMYVYVRPHIDGTGSDGVDWIQLAEWGPVTCCLEHGNDFWFASNARRFLKRWWTVRFCRMTLPHGGTYLLRKERSAQHYSRMYHICMSNHTNMSLLKMGLNFINFDLLVLDSCFSQYDLSFYACSSGGFLFRVIPLLSLW